MIIPLIWRDIMDMIYLFLQSHSHPNNESLYRFKIIYVSKSEAIKLFPKICATKGKKTNKETLSQVHNKFNLTV